MPSQGIGRAWAGGPARARIALLAALGVCALLLLAIDPPWAVEGGPGLAGGGRPFRSTVMIGLWWAAAVDAVALLGLLASASLWARPLRARLDALPVPRVGRVFFVALLAAAGVAGLLRAPLASKSFWWDEGWSITRVVRGEVRPDPADPRQLVLDERHWARTIWYWKKPTNHVLYNMSGRASLEVWRALSGRGPEAVDEFVFRLPAFVAGLLAIVGIGVLGWRFGFPAAGVTAAWWVALHPWAGRYAVDGRGYAFVVPLAVLAALALHSALRSGAWKHWLLYAASQWWLLWTHPFMIYLTGVLGLMGMIAIAATRVPTRDRVTLALRFVVANASAALAFLLVMGPNLTQTIEWSNEAIGPPLDWDTVRGLWALIASGVPLHLPRDPGLAGAHAALEAILEQQAWLWPVIWIGLPLLVAFGLGRVWRRRDPARYVLTALMATAPISMGIVTATGQLYYPRFMTFAVIGTGLCLAIGWEGIVVRLAGPHPARAAAGLALGLMGFVALSLPQTRLLLERPIAPLRDVGQYERAKAGDDPLSVLRVGYGLGGGMPKIYDPWIRYAASRADLERAIDDAERAGVPLYVHYGQERFNRGRRPDGFELLDDPALFREEARFYGLEPRFLYHVLRYSRGEQPARTGSNTR